MEPSQLSPDAAQGRFHTTRWSLVVAAGADSREALSSLCRLYWYPAYAFLRRRGHARDVAEDLTQGFFARLIERGDFARADPERGRFRSYLLTALKHHAANHHEAERAQKRGGGKVLSLDLEQAERRYCAEPADPSADAADAAFLRGWAFDVLEQALASLERAQSGKAEQFARLRPWLTGVVAPGALAEAAAELQLTEGALKVALHRLRKAFGAQVRAIVAETVDDPAEIVEEIGVLLEALR